MIIPYIDIVASLYTALAAGAFQKAHMRGLQYVRAAKAHEETPAKAALRAEIKARDKGRRPGTEAEAMLRDAAFRSAYPYGVDALAKLIVKTRS